jgi:alpha-1,3-rhamnosyl/mannosyltransferase
MSARSGGPNELLKQVSGSGKFHLIGEAQGSALRQVSGLRLAVDATPLLFRSAGVKNYIYHWLIHLQRAGVPAGLNLRIFPWLTVPAGLNHEASVCGAFGTVTRLALWHFLNLGPNRMLDWVGPASDVFHASKLLNPPRRSTLTATLHDTTAWLTPQFHTPGNVAGDKLLAERIWRRADGLIAVSESTRNDAVRLLGLDPRRIEVIHHGIPDAYFEVGPAETARVRDHYGLATDYLLYVGTVEPRKNLATLLDAYEALPPDVRRQFPLVLAGPPGWSSGELLSRLRSSAPGVRYLGYVPEDLLPGLFAGASLFAYVSFYEGFGFPVVQAMAAGAPVLTSAVSSLPEVAGGAAELVDPHSPDAIRAALLRLLTSPDRRSALAVAGRVRARDFRWERCADLSLRFFERVAGRGGA